MWVMMADVDHFKKFNLTFGNDMGDELLKAIAQKLHNSIRAGDWVCRHGGDGFLLAGHCSDESEMPGLAGRILTAIRGLTISKWRDHRRGSRSALGPHWPTRANPASLGLSSKRPTGRTTSQGGWTRPLRRRTRSRRPTRSRRAQTKSSISLGTLELRSRRLALSAFVAAIRVADDEGSPSLG